MEIDTTIIIPQQTIGGVYIGSDVFQIIEKLNKKYHIVDLSENIISVNDGLLKIYYDLDSYVINMVSCDEKFEGKYRNKLWAGMTVLDIVKHSKSCIAWAGFVEVDNIHGIGLPLPDEYDDFDYITDYLDYNYTFRELFVY